MPEEYYLHPDWERLKEKSREFFYGNSAQEQSEIPSDAAAIPPLENETPAEDAPTVPAEPAETDVLSEPAEGEDGPPQSETKPPTEEKESRQKNIKGSESPPPATSLRKTGRRKECRAEHWILSAF